MPDAALYWIVRGEDARPAGPDWLAPGEAALAAGHRYTKRRNEYLLRRLVAKHGVALLAGRSTDPATLAAIEVRNAASGAPYVLLDGRPHELDLSITDRAGWAVCLLGNRIGGRGPVGCDLELIEPRSPGFVRDFLVPAEQRFVDARPAGDERDAAANLIWSAKESTLKVLGVGLGQDTRSVEVCVGPAGVDGWGALSIRTTDGGRFPGWWRREGRFLLTVATTAAGPSPVALVPSDALATAVPRHSWAERPLRP